MYGYGENYINRIDVARFRVARALLKARLLELFKLVVHTDNSVINIIGPSGDHNRTLLLCATATNQPDAIKFILSKHRSKSDMAEALNMLAANPNSSRRGLLWKKRKDAFTTLLECGANPNNKDRFGKTAFDAAIENERVENFTILINWCLNNNLPVTVSKEMDTFAQKHSIKQWSEVIALYPVQEAKSVEKTKIVAPAKPAEKQKVESFEKRGPNIWVGGIDIGTNGMAARMAESVMQAFADDAPPAEGRGRTMTELAEAPAVPVIPAEESLPQAQAPDINNADSVADKKTEAEPSAEPQQAEPVKESVASHKVLRPVRKRLEDRRKSGGNDNTQHGR